MRELKSDIIHAIYQCSGVDNDKLVEVSNICDEFQSRLEAAEALKPSHNNAMVPCLDVGAIVNRVTLSSSEKYERLRELLAQHQ